MSWEDTFKSWGSPPGDTEKQKMENAETAIKKAVKANEKLSAMKVSVIRQGSYRSRTNVRQNSDVDMCVCLNSTFFANYPAGKTREDYYNSEGSISFQDFKNLVHVALGDYFGYENITPGNKAFDIHSNSYRVDADVLPALGYRLYVGEGSEDYLQPTGVTFNANGKRIVNWPEQTYKNGNEKQDNTGERYKKMVRIVKKLRDKMQVENVAEANDIGSFLIESLVWNVPNEGFNHDTYTDDVRYVVAHCFNITLENGSYASLYEVNKLKKLFGSHQPWTRERTHAFFSKAWDYLGFK